MCKFTFFKHDLDVWWGSPCRVVFISSDKVVFEFEYDHNYLDFAEKDRFLYPDTMMKKEGIKPIVLHISAHSPSSIVSASSAAQSSPEWGRSYISADDIENGETIEETPYYKVICSDFMYCYYIFDENHDIVESDGPSTRQPHISMVNDHLVKFTLQAGTGLSTQWGYYYDTQKDVRSRIFNCIYDQHDGKVAYGTLNKVVVRDIFDKTQYYREISGFEKTFSPANEPIINARFINNGASVEIMYLTGDDYQEVVEIFDLEQILSW